MRGAGNRTYYVPGARFIDAQKTPGQGVVPTLPNSHQGAPDSRQPGSDGHHPLVTIPAHLAARIPPAGSKPRRDTLRALILDLCRWRAMSARELASILHGREHKPFVRDHLTPMVAEGLLVYTIPAMENHPEQRYTVPSDPLMSDEPTS